MVIDGYSGNGHQIELIKELVPIVLSIAVWGPYLKKTSILLQSDNLSLVTAINKGSCTDAAVMYLLRWMWFFVAHFDITIVAKHLPRVDNLVADKLSRNSADQTFLSSAGLSCVPTPLPFSILQMISPKGLDCLSPHFHKLLEETPSLVTKIMESTAAQ